MPRGCKVRRYRALLAFFAAGFLSSGLLAEELDCSPAGLAQAAVDYVNFDLASPAGKLQANYYYYFVMGVMNTLRNDGKLCISAPLQGSQVATLVANYLTDHPERWGENTTRLIYEALQPTLGCPSTTTTPPSRGPFV